MTSSEDLHILTCHQFPRWSTSITRPRSGLPAKDAQDMFQLGIDNRHPRAERPTSSSVTTGPTPHVIRHRVRIPSVPRISSPLLHQPTSSPEILSVVDRSSPISATARSFRPMPIRLKSTTLTVPQASPESSLQNFPKQTHERRKSAQNRKRRKQQAQTLAGKYAETETWFQLRQSLAELKRLATTQQIVVDPTLSLFNCDGYSFEALKQAMIEQQEADKLAMLMLKSESGVSSSCDSVLSSNVQNRSNMIISHNRSPSNFRSGRRATVTYERPAFEPFTVASKPIHLLLANSNHQQGKGKEKHYDRSPSAPLRPRPLPLPAPVAEQRAQLLLSDLSNEEDLVLPLTPPPVIIQEEQQSSSRRLVPPLPARPRPPSSVTLSSNIKIKPQVPRCRSAMDSKSNSNKHLPRFILITDQEHRIESWYHQYPFVLSDDLLAAFESSQQKSTVPAFFTDDIHSSSHHNFSSTKLFLQGKPFHIQNDWRKYDLILISNNIQEQIMHYLQTFIHLIGSTVGKQISIHSINHEEDLKVQVRGVCRNMQQQNL